MINKVIHKSILKKKLKLLINVKITNYIPYYNRTLFVFVIEYIYR